LDILGHITGSRKRSIWKTQEEQDVGIKIIITKWIKAVRRMRWNSHQELMETLNSTDYGPYYWTAITVRVTEEECIKILKGLKLKLHGKQRRIMRENINEAVRYREGLIKLGKTSQFIKAVLQETANSSNLEAIRDSVGEWKTKPVEVQEAFTEHFQTAYDMPEGHSGGIHQDDWSWQTGGTKEDFEERVRHHNIPQNLVDILWAAMNKVPKAPAIREELEIIFTSPPSYHEFCNAISAKPGRSSGGMSGLTYSMMKSWSVEYKKLIYDNLVALWGKPIPKWMKRLTRILLGVIGQLC
jgi:hypothetical protein